MHLKLDELIRSVQRARNSLVDLEDMSDAELDQLHKEFRRFREGHERAHGREKATPPHAPDTHELGLSTEPQMTKDYRVTKPCKFA